MKSTEQQQSPNLHHSVRNHDAMKAKIVAANIGWICSEMFLANDNYHTQ
jgi:hypothetical protein